MVVLRPLAVLIATLSVSLVASAIAEARLAYAVPTRSGDPLLYVADDAGGARQRVARGTMAAISPDGTRLAYVRNASAASMLEIADLTTTAIVKTGSACLDPVWSPDGTAILCRTERANRRGYITGGGLLRIDATTGGATVITRPRGWLVETSTWSPDGARIAYDLQRVNPGLRSRPRVIVAAADGSAKRVLTANGSGPVWGPTGRIAFTRTRLVRIRLPGSQRLRPYVRSQIWTAPADGGAARRLTGYRARGLTVGPSAAVWAPDGSALYGTIGGEDQSDPVRVDATTGGIRRLGVRDALVRAVSADGTSVLLETGLIGARPRALAVAASGGRARVLLRRAFDVSATPDWRP